MSMPFKSFTTELNSIPKIRKEGTVTLVHLQCPFAPKCIVAPNEGQDYGSIISERAWAFNNQIRWLPLSILYLYCVNECV